VRASINGADLLCWNLMRQVAGGDISNRNLWLAENMLELYAENRVWLDRFPILIASVIYTYLRILEDHHPSHLSSLKQKEVCVCE
jgi:integrator complex subunit 3